MGSPLPPDPYETLGVGEDAEISAIRTAHRKLVLKNHPDRIRDPALQEEGRARFFQVQNAYEILSDPIRRQKYDNQVKLAELKREAIIRGPQYTQAYSTRPAPAGSIRPYEGRLPRPFPPPRGSSESGDRYDYDYPRPSASRKRVEKATSSLSPAAVAASSAMRQASGAKRTSEVDWKQEVKDREKLYDNYMKARTARTAYLVERDQSDSDSTDSTAYYSQAKREPGLEKPTFSRSQTMPMRKPQNPSDANTATFKGSKLKHAHSFDNGRPGVDRPGLYSTGYWGESRRQSGSVGTRHSSRNGSLGGGRKFEREYQTPEFVRPRAGSGSDYGIRATSPGMPPRPKPRTHKRYRSVSSSDENIIYYPPPNTRTYLHRRRRSPSPEPVRRRDSRRDRKPYGSTEQRNPRPGQTPPNRRDRERPKDDKIDKKGTVKDSRRRELKTHDNDRMSMFMTLGEPARTFKTANKNAAPGRAEDGPTEVIAPQAQVEQEGLIEAAEPYAVWKSLDKLKNAPGSHSRVSSPEAELTADFRDCYICGDTVQIKRKRDWQKHVLEDLRPYQCLEDSCSTADSTYSHLKDLKTHYRVCHHAAAMMDTTVLSCVFCGEDLALTLRTRFSHVGRHMEEISFAVIPRQYEDWEFYSESTMAMPRDLPRRSRMPLPASSRTKQKPSDLWSQLGSSVQPGQDSSKSRKRPQRETPNSKEDSWSFGGASRKDKKDERSDLVALSTQQKLEAAKKENPAEEWSGKCTSRKEKRTDPSVTSIDHNVTPRDDDDSWVASAGSEHIELWGAGVSKKDRKKRRTVTERISPNPESTKMQERDVPVRSRKAWVGGTS